MRRYWKYVKPYLSAFIIGPIFMIVEVIGEVIMPLLLSNIIDKGVIGGRGISALAVEDIEEVQEQLEEQVDSIDEDLEEFARILFDEEEDDDVLAQIECPHCNKVFDLTEDMIDGDSDSFECPYCHEEIAFEWDCDCEDCSEEEENKE